MKRFLNNKLFQHNLEIGRKIRDSVWYMLLVFIFLRPFLSEYAFHMAGLWYIFIFLCLASFYIAISVRQKIIPRSNYSFPVFLFALAIALPSACSGLNAWSGVQLYLFLPNLLIFYLTTILGQKQRRQLVVTVFISAGIISIYALNQYFGGPLFVEPAGYMREFIIKKRVFAPFLSPNILASYMIMMFFLGSGILLGAYIKKEKASRWIAFVLFLMSAVLLLTKSLGGILVFMLSAFIFIALVNSRLFSNPGLKKESAGHFRRIIIPASCLFALAFFFIVGGRLAQLFNIHNQYNPLTQRLYYWFTSLKVFKDFPLTGAGWASLEFLCRPYSLPHSLITGYSHNVFLQIALELGVPGFLSFALIVYMFFRTALRSLKCDDARMRALNIGLFCAGCGFLLHNLIDLSFYFGQVSLFWWVILGLFNNRNTDEKDT
jgi:putative inorganic carbon (hco3(-)) transporter